MSHQTGKDLKSLVRLMASSEVLLYYIETISQTCMPAAASSLHTSQLAVPIKERQASMQENTTVTLAGSIIYRRAGHELQEVFNQGVI